jgi:hypothetical protein
MRVAFLKPLIGGILGLEMLTFVEPLGPISIAGGLEADGHECRIFDLRIDGLEAGIAACRAFEPRVVGLQCSAPTFSSEPHWQPAKSPSRRSRRV